MVVFWRSSWNKPGPEQRNSAPAFRVSPSDSRVIVANLMKEKVMKPLAILTGLAGALLMTTIASSASAQARYYPDGTNCSLLDDSELVACQNQIYTRQLESGVSQQGA